ncbi:TolC family outer membrane protein [Schlegelella sp. S2-27]|uniref:TolC family outer membrane protein n=1 Tax=Caldimonas mangrovi TaxID=2944811 RepID=A0ABT0YVY8_9BURK|nr:TolC family outer membrane protein [Caldimonas mangrovi]MCM5682905.1 TolC family outer membrane protein [Caldimonas mangrovi]
MTFRTSLTTVALLLSCVYASAQSPDALQAVARKAIETHPDIGARLNGYRASVNEVDVGRAGYYPRLDLSASAGRDRDRIGSRDPQSSSIDRTGASLSLTQMLWDGLATHGEVRRLGHAKLTRYFEFVDTAEQVALEAVQAHYDVLRYRRLVALAEDNYVQHKASHDQILSRFRAGVSRGVDLEQAAARLALAESNLSTEVANLHDVSARYQRIVGELPPARIDAPAALKQGLPSGTEQALQTAVARNGAVAAAVENLRSVRAQADTRQAAFQPRIELRARSGVGHNYDSVRDQRRDTTAEVVVSWNLFNGGADHASVRQFADLVNQAADQRDRVCRDIRQTAVIAYNDTLKLVDQLRFLDANQLAIEKARDAYRKQFDIGQRSLLDLLNSENELYTARRAYANAEVDLDMAYARVHAATGNLLVALGLSRPGTGPQEAEGWSAGEDAAARCPAAGPEVALTPRAELDERARRLSNSQPEPARTLPAPAPAPR